MKRDHRRKSQPVQQDTSMPWEIARCFVGNYLMWTIYPLLGYKFQWPTSWYSIRQSGGLTFLEVIAAYYGLVCEMNHGSKKVEEQYCRQFSTPLTFMMPALHQTIRVTAYSAHWWLANWTHTANPLRECCQRSTVYFLHSNTNRLCLKFVARQQHFENLAYYDPLYTITMV